MSNTELFDPGNTKFRALLGTFHKIIKNDPNPQDVEDELKQLSEMAKTTSDLTGRQVEAITARCANYIKGDYGKTKKPEHYEHAKPSKS